MINHCQLYFNLELDRWLFAGKEGHVGSRELLSFTSCCWHLRAVRGAGLGKRTRVIFTVCWLVVVFGDVRFRCYKFEAEGDGDGHGLFRWMGKGSEPFCLGHPHLPWHQKKKKNPVYLITCYFLLICNLQSWCRTQENRLYVAQLKLKSNPSWNMARLWIAFGLKSLKVILKS